ncbi:hypothetical protein R1sor_004295 [Riccia sorocarpa]|uniref:Fucosyltransferase n=1 Tax=Riccia sorocarpa TaxID=122646 RepID=A0ABD3HJT2_9MARC
MLLFLHLLRTDGARVGSYAPLQTSYAEILFNFRTGASLVVWFLGMSILYVSLSALVSQQWQIEATSNDNTSIRSIAHKLEDNFLKLEEEKSGTSGTQDWKLLARIRGSVRAAGGIPGSKLSDLERQEWQKQHSCEGREQLLGQWIRKENGSTDRETRRAMLRLFEEYSNLHRTCTQGGNMSYVSDLYKQRENGVTKCKFLVVEFGVYGIGNRMLWLISAYMYALLTQRVLLLDTRDTMHQVLCDPFPGSSWQLPRDFPYSSSRRWVTAEDFFRAWDAWEEGKEQEVQTEEREKENEEREYTVRDLERESREVEILIQARTGTRRSAGDWPDLGEDTGRRRSVLESHSRGAPPNFTSVQANEGWTPNARFFCSKTQERLDQVPWVSLSGGCLYFLPDLFAISTFRPVLESLFPRRDPLTHLLRQIAHPVDPIWNRVQAVQNAHFRDAKTVVGMQLRFRDGGGMYSSLNGVVNQKVMDCALERNLIPSNSFNTTYLKEFEQKGGPPVVIFIASLHRGLQNHLREYYAAILEWQQQKGKELLKLMQMSEYGFQAFDDLDGDFQAFAELLMLSLVDELFTSPQSTFGYVAQAYGGLRPLLIEFNPSNNANCQRGQSSDGCYHEGVTEYKCPSEPKLDGKSLTSVVPYLRPCQDFDGLQLVPPADEAADM